MPPRQNAICWEKSGNTVLLISCPSLYPYHSRLATSNSAVAAFEDGAPYPCYRQIGRWSSGVRLLHDNARPHVSRQTQELLTNFGWTIVPDPSNSPDLAPIKEEVTQFLKELAAEFYNMGIENLEHRLMRLETAVIAHLRGYYILLRLLKVTKYVQNEDDDVAVVVEVFKSLIHFFVELREQFGMCKSKALNVCETKTYELDEKRKTTSKAKLTFPELAKFAFPDEKT
ncbi:hypothetical protein J6590_048478 [Homalodisca vitripennis]|nr:hypothetical protein J6590_048478 [Homalodisca vitripennis]